MPSDDAVPANTTPSVISGRCYCGETTLSANTRPHAVSYCHCSDCRRVTGAPVAAFAAFARAEIVMSPAPQQPVSINPGVNRWFCRTCGSPVAATFDYLPDAIYIPLGVIDQAGELLPQLHSHADQCLPWLNIDDSLDRQGGSARNVLNSNSVPVPESGNKKSRSND